MKAKKIMTVTALVILGITAAFIFILYATIKTRSTSLNKVEPFREWTGKTVTLHRETILYKEKVSVNGNNDYPYILLDNLHPQWQLVKAQKGQTEPELEEIMVFPAGTLFKLEKAVQYTNGVSGFSYPTVFGTISFKGKTYHTGYQWGQMDIVKSFDKIDKCWQFHQAPWQMEKDTAFYALPKARIW